MQQDLATTGSSSSSSNSSDDSSADKAKRAVEDFSASSTRNQTALCQLAHAVAAMHQALECKAAAAAAAVSSTGKGARSSSSSSGLGGVRYHPEALAQLHHAHIMVSTAVRAAATELTDITACTTAAAGAAQKEQHAELMQQLACSAAAAAAAGCSAEQLAAFQQQCATAWQQSRQGRQATSYLQQQVSQVRAYQLQVPISNPILCTAHAEHGW
jgi:hypothetical protein